MRGCKRAHLSKRPPYNSDIWSCKPYDLHRIQSICSYEGSVSEPFPIYQRTGSKILMCLSRPQFELAIHSSPWRHNKVVLGHSLYDQSALRIRIAFTADAKYCHPPYPICPFCHDAKEEAPCHLPTRWHIWTIGSCRTTTTCSSYSKYNLNSWYQQTHIQIWHLSYPPYSRSTHLSSCLLSWSYYTVIVYLPLSG